MRVKWLGHSSFLFTSDKGIRIITDPYKAGGGLKYREINEAADVVLISHEHGDHNNPSSVKGKPQVLKDPGVKEAKGIKFTGISAFHDEAGGSKRGSDTIFCFELDGLRICHLGDLGHELDDAQVKRIGKIDILFVPIGGFYTFEPDVATKVVNRLAPKVIIPMHFKTSGVDTATFGAIVGPDDFLKGKSGVDKRNSSEAEFQTAKMPAAAQIVVLKPAL